MRIASLPLIAALNMTLLGISHIRAKAPITPRTLNAALKGRSSTALTAVSAVFEASSVRRTAEAAVPTYLAYMPSFSPGFAW